MTFRKALIRSSIMLVSLGLGSCATNVQHYTDLSAPHVIRPNEPIGSVTVTLSPSGQKDFADNAQFSQNALLTDVDRVLQAKKFFAPNAGKDTLEIQITAIRVRSTFNAVMWGFMAGSDYVTGDVYLRDSSGKLLNHFSVHAGTALGGIAAGSMSARWGWIDNKFAQLVAKNLSTT